MKLFKAKKKSVKAKPDVIYNIPRTSFVWLLVSVAAVILPHVMRMPVWLSITCLLCIIGRSLIYQGRISFPSKKVKTVIVFLMVVLVVNQFGRQIFSTDATVGVLLTGITLKLLEMQRKRDVLIVLYLCYFTVIAEFIYSQTIPITIYMFFVVVLITSGLMSLNKTQDKQSPVRTLKLSAQILLQSVPLMLVVFVLFPRMGPLWNMPIQTSASKTGLSENMSPGDIGNLARSADVAFRVQFADTPPAYNQLYWRALTLDEFDGREWRRGFSVEPQYLGANSNQNREWFDNIELLDQGINYNVILEPTNQNWIYTLQMPQIVDDRMLMRRDYQVDTIRRISQRFSYDARSFPSYRTEAPNARETRRFTMFPQQSNERIVAFAKDLHEELGSDQAYIAAVMRHFNQEEFFYTLSPPTLGDNSVDEFFFETRSGFCEHYASAFTLLMRAAGIPARVVTGYMGGEYNPYDGTLTIRQYDAHAWSEVWLDDAGWVRYDPTAAVAPQRVEQGSDVTLQQEDAFMDDEVFSLMRFRNSLLLNELRFRLEMMDYAWNRFVLNYDQDTQVQFLNAIFGTITTAKILVAVLSFMGIMLLIIIFAVFRSSPLENKPYATRLYLKFCSTLAKAGYVRAKGETPQSFMQRLCEINPQWRRPLEDITQSYIELAFIESEPQAEKLKSLKRKIQHFKLLA